MNNEKLVYFYYVGKYNPSKIKEVKLNISKMFYLNNLRDDINKRFYRDVLVHPLKDGTYIVYHGLEKIINYHLERYKDKNHNYDGQPKILEVSEKGIVIYDGGANDFTIAKIDTLIDDPIFTEIYNLSLIENYD